MSIERAFRCLASLAPNAPIWPPLELLTMPPPRDPDRASALGISRLSESALEFIESDMLPLLSLRGNGRTGGERVRVSSGESEFPSLDLESKTCDFEPEWRGPSLTWFTVNSPSSLIGGGFQDFSRTDRFHVHLLPLGVKR
eukprot:1348613-Amorphochlora_amoeboformis.AAC.1